MNQNIPAPEYIYHRADPYNGGGSYRYFYDYDEAKAYAISALTNNKNLREVRLDTISVVANAGNVKDLLTRADWIGSRPVPAPITVMSRELITRRNLPRKPKGAAK